MPYPIRRAAWHRPKRNGTRFVGPTYSPSATTTLQIRDLSSPAPATGYGVPQFGHSRRLAYPDHDLSDRLDFLHRSPVVQRALEVAFELGVHLARTGVRMGSQDIGLAAQASTLTSCGIRPASRQKLLSAGFKTLVLLNM